MWEHRRAVHPIDRSGLAWVHCNRKRRCVGGGTNGPWRRSRRTLCPRSGGGSGRGPDQAGSRIPRRPALHRVVLPARRPARPLVGGSDSRSTRAGPRLLHASHSPTGGRLAVGAIEVERVRRHLATGTPATGDRYWIRVLGDPGGDHPWGWRINGHHLAVHAVVSGDRATLTPHFVGSEPAVIPAGKAAGRRLLGLEEDLARQLVTGLDPDQRTVAISADLAPDDIITRADPVADPRLLPMGIGRAQLRPHQQKPSRPTGSPLSRSGTRGLRRAVLARGRRSGTRHHPFRLGGTGRTRRRSLLLRQHAAFPDRVRQHPGQRQPRPLRMAPSTRRLGLGSAPQPLRASPRPVARSRA